MTPQKGDLVEVVDVMSALQLDCWPYGMVWDHPTADGRVIVVMLGDHVSRGNNGAGCRVWLVEDLQVIHRPGSQAPSVEQGKSK